MSLSQTVYLLYLRHFYKYFLGSKNFQIKLGGAIFLIRPKSNDLNVVKEIFINEEYQPQLPDDKFKVDTICDLGAHIGIFSVWAQQKYKPKKLVAVEMDEENYNLLSQNLEINKVSAITLKRAVYSSNSMLGIKSAKHKSNYMIDLGSDNTKVKGISLGSIFKVAKLNKIDFLKIDIEGAERFILTYANENIFRNKIRYIHLESHGVSGYQSQYPKKYFSRLGFSVKLRPGDYENCQMIEAYKS